jgi:hypothetical protein
MVAEKMRISVLKYKHSTALITNIFICILKIIIIIIYVKPCIIFKVNISYPCISLKKNFYTISMHLSCVMRLPEDGCISGRNMWAVYGVRVCVYHILSYTDVHLLVLISCLRCAQRS